MLHYTTVFDLEIRYIASMTRQQLIDALRDEPNDLPADLREGLEEETIDHIQLLLLAARFFHALRQMRGHKPLGAPSGAAARNHPRR
jgi:hypothetical protein